jgi:hypothetical protein
MLPKQAQLPRRKVLPRKRERQTTRQKQPRNQPKRIVIKLISTLCPSRYVTKDKNKGFIF